MKKQLSLAIVLVILGNLVSFFFTHQVIQLPQSVVWTLGTIWFVLFLVYGLLPVGVQLLENKEN